LRLCDRPINNGRMTWSDAAFLVAAGVLGGLTGSIAGLASVPTYPALLLYGLPPVTANVTNTVALVFNGIGSALGSRPELRGQARTIMRMAPMAALGGASGAVLLLSTPADDFERVVPVLLGLASVAIIIPRRTVREVKVASHQRYTGAKLLQSAAVFLICVYGGYFGAAAGVLLLALMLRSEHAGLAHVNAVRNVTIGVANSVAAIIFALVAPVNWPAVVAVGVGCLVGSRIGPSVVRRVPAEPLRLLIGASGLALAIKLAIDAYG
jgi:uncharacterized protein